MNILESLKILDITERISKDELKKIYRKKALVLHPDVNKAANADESFKLLTAAYNFLLDNFHQLPPPPRPRTAGRQTLFRILMEGVPKQHIRIPHAMIDEDITVLFMIGLNEYRITLPKNMRYPTEVKIKNLDLTLVLTTYQGA